MEMPQLLRHKFNVEDSDNPHSKGIEIDNNQAGDKEFYKEDREIPANLFGKLRQQYEDFRSRVRQTVEKTHKAERALLISEEDIESMTDDELITLVKHEKMRYDSRILDLETCREEMMTLAYVMGKRISNRKRRVCG